PLGKAGHGDTAVRMGTFDFFNIEANHFDAVFDIEPVDLIGVIDAALGQNGNDAEGNSGLLKMPDPSHGLRVSALASPIFSECIVDKLRPIDADANTDPVFLKKFAPLGIDQGSVGLDGMDHVTSICR